MSTVLAALETAAQFLSRIPGAVLGFITAWVLFELTEWRRRRLDRRELRRALVAELKNVEVLLSTIVGKYAYLATTPEDVSRTASTIRWFLKTGRQRASDTGVSVADLPISALTNFENLTDDQIVQAFALVGKRETVGTKLILPVVDAVFAGRIPGFKHQEIQKLSTVKWQAHLLEQDADWTREFLRITFTVTDPRNHEIAEENHDRRLRSYAARAWTLLGCVRSALTELERRPWYMKWRQSQTT